MSGPSDPEELSRILYRDDLYFFYGSLMAPEVLKSILELDNEPKYTPAVTKEMTMKMWGPYPALVRPEEDENGHPVEEPEDIPGVLWEMDQARHFFRLKHYEGDNYKHSTILVQVTNPDGAPGEQLFVSTFEWVGPRSSLKKGRFDLATFREARRQDFC